MDGRLSPSSHPSGSRTRSERGHGLPQGKPARSRAGHELRERLFFLFSFEGNYANGWVGLQPASGGGSAHWPYKLSLVSARTCDPSSFFCAGNLAHQIGGVNQGYLLDPDPRLFLADLASASTSPAPPAAPSPAGAFGAVLPRGQGVSPVEEGGVVRCGSSARRTWRQSGRGSERQ